MITYHFLYFSAKLWRLNKLRYKGALGMKYFYRLLKVIILLALLVIALKNTQLVDFNWVIGEKLQWPLITLLLIFFVIGTVFGIFSMLGRVMSLRNENIRLRRELIKNAKIKHEEFASLQDTKEDGSENANKKATTPPIHP